MLTGYFTGKPHTDKTVRDFCLGAGEYETKHISEFLKTKIVNNSVAAFGILRGPEILINHCRDHNIDYYHLDHAYFNRGHTKPNPWYRVSKNRYQAGPIIERSDDRLKQFDIKTKPWQNGSNILVCPPTPAVSNFYGLENWTANTVNEIKKYTDRTIVLRQKPGEFLVENITGVALPVKPRENLGKSLNLDVKMSNVSLKEDLLNAWIIVSFNSGVAVTAICEGVPALVSEHSSVLPVALTDMSQIENPVKPDRHKWLCHLSYSQFNRSEMVNGYAWNILKDIV